MILACERGIFFLSIDDTKKNLTMTQERYLNDSLVSQVFEYSYGKIIASVFNENGYKLIDRASGTVELLK